MTATHRAGLRRQGADGAEKFAKHSLMRFLFIRFTKTRQISPVVSLSVAGLPFDASANR